MALLQSKQTLKTHDIAPDFSLVGVDDTTYTLESFNAAKALLVVFMCNHCPYVIPKIDTMNQLHAHYKNKGLVIVGINPNDASRYPEDSFLAMKEFVSTHTIEYPYLHDPTQKTAKAYGAVCTPDPFLFNAKRALVYQGRFDDALAPEAIPTTRDMADAIESVLSGGEPKQAFLFSQGCSIKWRQ